MLSHYSKYPNKVFSPAHPAPPDNEHKPGGLWLSDESGYGWSAFVLDQFQSGSSDWADGKEMLRYRYDFVIDLSQLHQILLIETTGDRRRFTAAYREPSTRGCVVDGQPGLGLHIEWRRVKSDYKGVLITPYQPRLSHTIGNPEFHWYRFDCASGCFWDISCLMRVHRPPAP